MYFLYITHYYIVLYNTVFAAKLPGKFFKVVFWYNYFLGDL